ncbi:putative ribonuclease E inhibitor RraA/RraA-like protein [Septoria linicola]|nr:putative ribonuclease E inhibitor RraA/RraA-like protein [Septoria linicola]
MYELEQHTNQTSEMTSRRSSIVDIPALCEAIRRNYSPCDVSDALQVLSVPGGGYLADIHPLPSRTGCSSRVVAPISTVLFVDQNHKPGDASELPNVPTETNISGVHWTDVAPAGNVVLMQQPPSQIVGVLGDIVATRYKVRGLQGVVIDGRARDNAGCGALCSSAESEGGTFQVWSKALTSVGTSLQAKPWAVDVPIKIGLVTVRPGDIIVADEAEHVCCVIPGDKLTEVVAWLPKLKKADEGVLKDAQDGVDLATSFGNWPDHYTQQK